MLSVLGSWGGCWVHGSMKGELKYARLRGDLARVCAFVEIDNASIFVDFRPTLFEFDGQVYSYEDLECLGRFSLLPSYPHSSRS